VKFPTLRQTKFPIYFLQLFFNKDLFMLSGAEYVENLIKILENTGFTNILMMPKDNSREIIKSWVPGKKVEDFVASYIIEAKNPTI